MKQEDKELLLKDLCARFPYKIKVKVSEVLYPVELDVQMLAEIKNNNWYEYPIPYLRPISSMTDEEFESLKEYSGLKYEQLDLASYQNGAQKCLDFYLSEVPSYIVILVFDWLNEHHFDYRGLIERGLAIEVTEENNVYKN